MISEAIFSDWRSEWRWGAWLIVGLVVIGTASFFENGGWEAAVRVPLGVAAFIVVSVVIADFLIWLFGKGKLGKPWYSLLVISVLSLGALSFLANPVFLVLLAFLVSSVLLIAGVMKPALYKRYGKK